MKAIPDISYVLTVYNKAWALQRTLASLRAQSGGHDVEFVFVDDLSTDGSRDYLTAEASKDPRIRLIANETNLGPSIRINQGAAAAKGRLLHLLDGDDVLPPNATDWMQAALLSRGSPLIFGRRRIVDKPAPISVDTEVIKIDEPLVFAARRPIVHIALMVERELYLAAGGADQTIFIQDQSLSLRLTRHSANMLWTEATVVCGMVADDGTLSDNKIQQHHDRFFSAFNLLQELPADHPARGPLTKMAVSALWKLRRDQGGLKWASGAFARYIANRAGLWSPGASTLQRLAESMRQLSGVRRPDARYPAAAFTPSPTGSTPSARETV